MKKVEIYLTKPAFRMLEVKPIDFGINSLPRWLRNCKTSADVENAIYRKQEENERLGEPSFSFSYWTDNMLVISSENETIVRKVEIIYKPFMTVEESVYE